MICSQELHYFFSLPSNKSLMQNSLHIFLLGVAHPHLKVSFWSQMLLSIFLIYNEILPNLDVLFVSGYNTSTIQRYNITYYNKTILKFKSVSIFFSTCVCFKVTRCAELRVRRELVYTGGALRGHSKPLWSENTPSAIRTHTQSSKAIGPQAGVGHVIV